MVRSVFLGADDRLRAGWAVLGFGVMAAFAYGLLSSVVAIVGLAPRAPYTLDDPRLLATGLVMVLAATVATAPLVLIGRQSAGLSPQRLGPRLALGAGAGALVVSVAIVVPVLVGQGTLHFSGGAPGLLLASGLQQLLCLGPTAVGEELLVRGVPLRVLARGAHPVVAVLVTGGVFGLLHLFNPAASWLAALNVSLVGFWLGALVLRTGSLWPAVGAHVAWNWFEGFFWGQAVSGLSPGRALFTGQVPAHGFWGGGRFGPEASGWTAVVLLLALALTAWRRPGPPADEAAAKLER